MNQTKNNNVDAARADNKRERRRVPSGRAAVLRRAPSDSDCSGETASLSADSGDRAVRPAPPPPRQTKTRRLHISTNNRRRGSEWEVLEGLKDGQRFEKRPDVFNGYLHKKRKWPLKGWHKRFFVVDGGILVYARSPADVARGRLHGSVDVGLSVISAKARRRRIDIDADEFIYHLRAKTPDLFRTWLNVLKAHRLYRQHLLTFGARESVPKIHAPADELPATDTSSHTSVASSEMSVATINGSESPTPVFNNIWNYDSSIYMPKVENSIFHWQQKCYTKGSLEPFHKPLEQMFDVKFDHAIYKNHSMCSMHCVEGKMGDLIQKKSAKLSINSGEGEKQIICTDLDQNSLKNSLLESDPNGFPPKKSLFINNLSPPPTTCFFFTRKKPFEDSEILSDMKKSRKCTNLVKYKNLGSEPPLKAPPSKCMLLGKYKLKNSNEKSEFEPFFSENKSVHACELYEADILSIAPEQKHVAAQNAISGTDYDMITEKLMVSIFHKHKNGDNADDIRLCVDNIVKDLYEISADQALHPVKALYRALLEYWLKNTSLINLRDAIHTEKAVDRQSNKFFTRDEYLSTLVCNTTCKEKETQVNEVTHVKKVPISPPGKRKSPQFQYSPIRDTECYEKERRIQELEKLLKNTVYICETPHSHCREKDINITKKLIDNLSKTPRKSEIEHREVLLDKKSRKVDAENGDKGKLCKTSKKADTKSRQKTDLENSESSNELPEIQETINHLISETAIPTSFAKDFLGAYLDVLMNGSRIESTPSHISWSGSCVKDTPVCEVLTEAIVKKVSKSMTTFHPKKEPDKLKVTEKQPESGQICMKDVLEKITTIFSRVKKNDNNASEKHKPVPKQKENKVIPTKNYLDHNTTNVATKDKLATNQNSLAANSKHNFIYKNSRETSLIIDLANYSLEHISTSSDPFIKGVMSISIKVKEKSNQTHLNMEFADEVKPIITPEDNSENWGNFINDDSRLFFNNLPISLNHSFVPDDADNEMFDLKPYSSISEATSKACGGERVSEYSLGLSFPSNDSTKVIKNKRKESQPCFLMSIKKGSLTSIKKKAKIKENPVSPKSKSPNKTLIKLESKPPLKTETALQAASKPPSKPTSVRSASPELSVFEKPAPRIIDEKFILLLLEHLMILSKSVPSLFKDINSLYIRLKKKHEKVLRNCNNIQGLSLLGKIYNESSVTGNFYKTTQVDSDLSFEVKNCSSKCCSTHAIKLENKEVGTVSAEKSSKHIDTQTINEDLTKVMRPMIQETTASSYFNDRMAVITKESCIDHATSAPSWLDNTTEDTPMKTFIKRVLNENPNLAFAKSKNHRGYLTKRRHSPTVKQELVQWILSPSVKESDKTTNRRAIKQKERFNVYQLFCSQKFELQASSSLTVATQDSACDGLRTVYRCSSGPSFASGLVSPGSPPLRGPQAGFVSGTPGGRLAGWIIESGGPLDNMTRELGQAQLSVQQLQRLLDALELQQQVHHDTDTALDNHLPCVSLEGASPSVKKDRRKFGLRKKKSNSKCASVELAPPHIDPSNSHTALSALTAPPSPGGGASSIPNSAASLPIACAAARPQSLPSAESMVTIQAGPASLTSLTPDHQLREDFTILAKDLVASLKGIVSTMVCERSRLRAAMEAVDSNTIPNNASMAALRSNLSTALQQNSELRSRLSRIHDASDIAEMNEARAFQQSLSYSSSCVSASEFFDAEEHEDDLKPEIDIPADETGVIELDGDSSSEAGSLSSEEDVDAGSASSDNSEGAMLSAEAVTLRHEEPPTWTRRTRLPTPRPAPGGPSLWNLLYKNIGKDLSQISMPVTINEPTNMLQRLCEELEYSELLDAAADCNSALERMSLIAAFAVSAYAASAHRAASKPFNPLLHETYECIRDDRGFRFLAEQVSHHPPISACHAESPRWCFWQEARIKTKFWGKSMEFQPTGRVHVKLNTTGDHYTWNKVTTCVHNLFGGQRWVDQYGDMHITCVGTDISCKLNFIKASSWSQSRHEVRGVISMGRGARLRLQGRWSEALYAGDPPAARCLWRPGAMPPDHELYYGFTRFAMELNELEPGMREILPHTDTRLRPDQRALEEGLVDAAEQLKHELEQAQRERRRDSLQHTPAWFRKTIEDGEETWVFSGEYWKARAAGFSPDCAPRIW